MTFDKFCSLILEMPQSIGNVKTVNLNDNSIFNRSSNFEPQGSFILQFLTVEIFLDKRYKYVEQKRYIMVNNEKIIGEYIGTELEANGIQTYYNQSEPFIKSKSLMFAFYTNFLLEKYKFIESDSSLSDKAFRFWFNNFDNFKTHGFKIYATNGKKLIELNNKEELNEYYGDPGHNPKIYQWHYRIYK